MNYRNWLNATLHQEMVQVKIKMSNFAAVKKLKKDCKPFGQKTIINKVVKVFFYFYKITRIVFFTKLMLTPKGAAYIESPAKKYKLYATCQMFQLCNGSLPKNRNSFARNGQLHSVDPELNYLF